MELLHETIGYRLYRFAARALALALQALREADSRAQALDYLALWEADGRSYSLSCDAGVPYGDMEAYVLSALQA